MKPTPGITIRPFTITDYLAVIDLWKEAGLPYREYGRDSRSRLKKEILQNTCYFLVAETRGKIIGTILGTQDGRKGWVNRLAVAKDCQRQNIARALVDAVENHFSGLGLEVISCLIEGDNEISQLFFAKAGYQQHRNVLYFSKRKNEKA